MLKRDKKKKRKQEQKQCSLCQKMFDSRQALGGHMSCAHPGFSKAYEKKVKVREERQFERELLKQAKAVYREKYGGDAPMREYQLRKIKRELKEKAMVNRRNEFKKEIKEEYEPSQRDPVQGSAGAQE